MRLPTARRDCRRCPRGPQHCRMLTHTFACSRARVWRQRRDGPRRVRATRCRQLQRRVQNHGARLVVLRQCALAAATPLHAASSRRSYCNMRKRFTACHSAAACRVRRRRSLSPRAGTALWRMARIASRRQLATAMPIARFPVRSPAPATPLCRRRCCSALHI